MLLLFRYDVVVSNIDVNYFGITEWRQFTFAWSRRIIQFDKHWVSKVKGQRSRSCF